MTGRGFFPEGEFHDAEMTGISPMEFSKGVLQPLLCLPLLFGIFLEFDYLEMAG